MKLKHILNRLLLEDTLRQHLEKFPFLINALEDMGSDGVTALDTEVEFDESGVIPDIYVKLENEPIVEHVREKVHNELLDTIKDECSRSPILKYINSTYLIRVMVDNALEASGKDTIYKYNTFTSGYQLIYYFGFLYGKNMPVIPRQIVGKDRTPVLANAIIERIKLKWKRAKTEPLSEVDVVLGISNSILTKMVLSKNTTTFIKFVDMYYKMIDELITTLEDISKESDDSETVEIARHAAHILKTDANYNKPPDLAQESKAMAGFKDAILRFEQNLPIKGTDYYLKISSDPADKMRISISKFWSSCQNAYTGSHRDRLPATVHDKNTKVAYVLADTAFIDNKGNEHKQSPLMRVLIRFSPETGKFAFDGVYPNGMDRTLNKMFTDLIEKYLNKKHSTGYDTHYQDVPKSISSIKSYSDRFFVRNAVRKVVKYAIDKYPFLSMYMKYMGNILGDDTIDGIEEIQPEGNAVAAWEVYPYDDDRRRAIKAIRMPGGEDWSNDDAYNTRAEYALGLAGGWDGPVSAYGDTQRWIPEAYLLYGNLNEINILNNSIFSGEEKQYIKMVLNAFKFIRSDNRLYDMRLTTLTGYKIRNAIDLHDVLHRLSYSGNIDGITREIDRIKLYINILYKQKGETDNAAPYELELKGITSFILPLAESIKNESWLLHTEFNRKVTVAIAAEVLRNSTGGTWNAWLPFNATGSGWVTGGTRLISADRQTIPLEGEYIFELGKWAQ